MGIVSEEVLKKARAGGPSAALPSSGNERELVAGWLERLNQALASGDRAALEALFLPDGHWRDLYAFTWFITPCEGAGNIAGLMLDKQPAVQARNFAIAEGRTPPRSMLRAGQPVIEAIVQFETSVARGFGVVRLPAADPGHAFQFMTSLHELKGFEEKVGKSRPRGDAYSRIFGGANWKDMRKARQAFADREPTALVIGGGQAGLTVAATLGLLGVDTLVIDRLPNVGDCWRTRYHSLALHNGTEINHLPYLPFPPNWPTYLSKDMIADWLEAYVTALEINFWTSAELVSARFYEAKGTWEAVVRRGDGSQRTLRPKHLIFANGLVGFPRKPDLPGLKDFKGDVVHTADYQSGAAWAGKKALVVGTGTSAHDVAQDLHSFGAQVTMVQRGSTTVISIDPSAKMPYGIYDGIPLEDGDLLVSTNTLPVLRVIYKQISDRMVEMDRKMIDGLIAAGFKWDMGEDGTGHQMKIKTRYGGYYLDAGCASLIIERKVGLLQWEQLDRFTPTGVRLKDGSEKPLDLVITATGFETQEVLLERILGTDVAKKVGPVWGIAPDGEMNNMWRRTPQEGLWFVGGSFANCRMYSRFVAMQVKAIEEGLMPRR
jgi:cation diffusion facilitator CzcD-associated flavoprotein CzcO